MRLLYAVWPLFGRKRSERTIFRYLGAQADLARDNHRYADAAMLYTQALALRPRRGDLLVQLGHMLKEAGDYRRAERAYDDAARLLPGDADLALQRGHLFRRTGRLPEALDAYRGAQALSPAWEEPALQMESLDRDVQAYKPLFLPAADDPALAESPQAGTMGLVAELTPRFRANVVREIKPGVVLHSLGRRERSAWGVRRTIRGVAAIRGVCRSVETILEVQLLLDGVVICTGPVTVGFPLTNDRGHTLLRKFVFNLWRDLSMIDEGVYEAEVRCLDAAGGTLSFRDQIVIAAPLLAEDHPDSDGVVGIVEPDPALLERAIRSRGSMVRAAERRLFRHAPKTVLVMRTDQLGDLVSSIPAIRRLRELLPQARLVALLTAANVDFGRTLGLFDEIIEITFPDDPIERRRIMPPADQEALRLRLEPYHFDIAIDLAESDVSRPLLLLSGATFLYGVGGGDWPWLTAESSLRTHDRADGLDFAAHSAKPLALVETLGVMMQDSFRTLRRDDLDRPQLARFVLDDGSPFVVLHMGARIAFSRWPHFRELAKAILARTDRTVVLMTEDPMVRRSLPAGLTAHPRFQLIDERLTFDDFDALVSFADVLVGNDSGPKHLAALRGTHVVTLFTARINWNEWGQEKVGTIVSRRVPCAGCLIFHDADECGKDFACIADIGVEEVFAAMKLTASA